MRRIRLNASLACGDCDLASMVDEAINAGEGKCSDVSVWDRLFPEQPIPHSRHPCSAAQ